MEEMTMTTNERIRLLIGAFKADGYVVDPGDGVKIHLDHVGMVGVHNSAKIGRTTRYKRAYYLEGTPYDMGYLMGLLAEPDVSRMCKEFNEGIIPAFFDVTLPHPVSDILGGFLKEIVALLSTSVPQDLPPAILEEMKGLLEGCRVANQSTQVSKKDLEILNYGVDGLLAFVYTGNLPKGKRLPAFLRPAHLRVPFMCNGFSVSGAAVEGNGHFLGRDFMFPTANVFQDTACHIIRRPTEGALTVSLAASGMVGSITALNVHGVGGGVNMEPSGACDPARPGINSLLLLRHAIENGRTCEGAVAVMESAQRGVSWSYILADAATGKACVVEAGRSAVAPDFLSYPPQEMLRYLPDQDFLDAHPTATFRNGLMVRWSDTIIPSEYVQFNPKLFRRMGKTYHPAGFDPQGFINAVWTDNNCPDAYYFVPQREASGHVVLLSNHFLIPEMRLTAMQDWVNELTKGRWDSSQWRYDELCYRLMAALQAAPLTQDKARLIIDFLAPNGDFPSYYNAHDIDLHDVQVYGAVSLLDLNKCSIQSHFGYYADEWVTTTLPKYVIP
jgi:hypothetical protein